MTSEDPTAREQPSPDALTVRVDPSSVVGQDDRERVGRYPVLRSLGKGGMGQVLEVQDPELERAMAVKVVGDPNNVVALSKFVQEARLTGQLEHPNIVPVHELGRTPDGRPYFTMKRVEGRSLHELLSEPELAAQWSLVRLLGVLLKVCDAVAFAHSRGVIHRDLKPANVMVGTFGEVLVVDWGLAKQTDGREAAPSSSGLAPSSSGSESSAQMTADGTVVGTPAYMAPEQAAGQIDRLDRRADIYALGAILYHVLTGQQPYVGPDPWLVIDQVAAGLLVPPSERAPEREIPWELEAVVTRAMSVRRRDRYQSVEALKADVEAFLEGRVLSAARYTLRQRVWKWVRRNRAATLAGVALLLAPLLALAGIGLQRHREVRSHLDRARISAEEGDIPAALEAYQHVLAIAPAHERARAGVRRLRLAQGRQRVREAARKQTGVPGEEALVAVWRSRRREGESERPETPAERAMRERALAVYLAAVSALDRVLARTPVPAEALPLRLEAGRRLGWVAMLGGDYTMARRVLDDLRELGMAPAKVDHLVAQLERIKDRRQTFRRKRLLAIVADIARGLSRPGRQEGAPTLTDYIFESVAYRDQQTIDLLARSLKKMASFFVEPKERMVWSKPQRELIVYCCRVLGRLDMPESVPPLARWAARVRDPELAVEAGLALCNTRRPEALPVLLALRERFGANSQVWQRIRRRLNRIPESRGKAPQTAREYFQRGYERLERGERRRAIADFDRAIALDPKYVTAYNHRGLAHLASKQPKKALADFDRALAIEPREIKVRNNRGLARLELEDYQGAVEDFTLLIEHAPGFADAHNHRGLAWRELDRPGKALADFSKAISLDRANSKFWSNRGIVRTDTGDLKGARSDYDRALALDRSNGDAWTNRGALRRLQGDLDGAVADTTRALGLDPRNVEALWIRGRARAEKGHLKTGLDDLTRAVRLAPDRHAILCDRAYLLMQLGNSKEALAECNKVIAMKKDFPEAYNNRGLALMVLERHEEAAADFRTLLRYRPKYWRGWGNLGIARIHMGRKAEALKALDRAYDLAPAEAKQKLWGLMEGLKKKQR